MTKAFGAAPFSPNDPSRRERVQGALSRDGRRKRMIMVLTFLFRALVDLSRKNMGWI